MKKRPKRVDFKSPLIGKTFPQALLANIAVHELFVCIWPQQINLPRVDLSVCHYQHGENCQATVIKLPFENGFGQDCQSKRQLLFDKKSDFLDGEYGYFLEDRKKGNFFKIAPSKQTGHCCFFAGDYFKNLRFKEMLCKFVCGDRQEETLADYMYRNFTQVPQKQSFSFAVYFKVAFQRQGSCYLFNRNSLPQKKLPIYSIFAIGKKREGEHKPRKEYTAEEIGRKWRAIMSSIREIRAENKEMADIIRERLIAELLNLEE